MPDEAEIALSGLFFASSTASFVRVVRVSRDVDRANKVSVRVESAFAFVAPILRFVFPPAMGASLRRFVRVDVDQMNASQRSFVLNEFRESIKTPRIQRTIVLSPRRDLLFR